jgi:hypothetical protein
MKGKPRWFLFETKEKKIKDTKRRIDRQFLVMRCLGNSFWFGCTYAEPHGISEPDVTRSL